MEITALTTFLAPLLPGLLRGGQDAIDALTQKVGAQAVDQVRALWHRLGPRLAERPAAEEAVAKVAANPDEPRWRTALELQLEELLAADPALAGEIAALFEAAEGASHTIVHVEGDGAIGVGRDVKDSVIISGDNADVTR